MEPALSEGDILIIDPHIEFRSGMGVVRHHWGYKIRNVHPRGKGRYLLTPVNPAYKPEEIEAGEETRLYVPIKIVSMKDV